MGVGLNGRKAARKGRNLKSSLGNKAVIRVDQTGVENAAIKTRLV